MTWQERHKPLPKYRCVVRGCYEPARYRVVDHDNQTHDACDGHYNDVARRHMLPDDCLMVEGDVIEPQREPDYYQVKAGEWLTPVHRGYLMQCCDCGLVHRLDFRVIKPIKRKKGQATIQNAKYKVQFRAFREDGVPSS